MAYTTIDNPELYFQALAWSGNDVGTSRAFTFDGSEDMQPDLVWTKIRTGWSAKHNLWDPVRGATKNLSSDASTAETTTDQYGYVSAFGTDGFTGSNGTSTHNSRYLYNENGGTYVAWCWKESADAGFDINIHTGTGSSADVSHNLSAVPELIITKRRNDTQNWFVYTSTTGAQKALYLDTTSAEATQAAAYDATPTSSVINYGSDNAVNGSSDTYVAYLWRSVQGFSKIGSYEGNNNADGTFVYTGFRPAYVITKVTDTTDGWMIFDNKRNPHNVMNFYMTADGVGADSTRDSIDFVSNGFKLRVANTDCNNGSYIYMAFAESPFVNSEGVPTNAR